MLGLGVRVSVNVRVSLTVRVRVLGRLEVDIRDRELSISSISTLGHVP